MAPECLRWVATVGSGVGPLWPTARPATISVSCLERVDRCRSGTSSGHWRNTVPTGDLNHPSNPRPPMMHNPPVMVRPSLPLCGGFARMYVDGGEPGGWTSHD